MTKLKDKIEGGLNDVRILILGGQVLIGATFRDFFEPGFSRIPPSTQEAVLWGLAFMLIGMGPLLLPAAYHRIAEAGEDTARFQRLLNRVLPIALFPFAVGLATGLFLAAESVLGRTMGWIFGSGVGVLAAALWYGVRLSGAGRKKSMSEAGQDKESAARDDRDDAVADKVKQVLTELRMVLPGSQALLGFQFVIVLMKEFEQLPQSARIIHLASLLAVAVSTVLLITPAAYHRMVEQGESSERFYFFAGNFLLLAMAFLGLGMAGDFYVILIRMGRSSSAAGGLAGLLLALLYGTWFGYTAWKRRQRSPSVESSLRPK